MPLFLSSTFQQIYDDHLKVQEEEALKRKLNELKDLEDEKKKAKTANKMYKNGFILEKIQQQNEKRKKQRGAKKDKDTTNKDKEDTAAEKKSLAGPVGGKKGKKGPANKDQNLEYEMLVEELRNDLSWKDQELQEIRDELVVLREQNEKLRRQHRDEKINRQILEANKKKYIMLKELQENKGKIDDQTFFDSKRKNAKGSGFSNLKNQILE